MKKLLLLCFFSIILSESFAQVRLGLRFAPGISFSRVIEDTTLSFSGSGSGLRFFGGPEINFILGENYTFTTGIWYSARRTSIKVKELNFNEVYNLQYLQLPATLKLFTNDIAVDTKLYFQIGATLDTRLQERAIKVRPNDPYIEKFRRFDSSVLIGTGLQLQMGQNTYIFGGITYTRGLLNSISRFDPIQVGADPVTGNPIIFNFSDVQIKNDFLALDIGIRF